MALILSVGHPDWTKYALLAKLVERRLGGIPVRQRDLSDIAGSWKEEPKLDQAIAEQDQPQIGRA